MQYYTSVTFSCIEEATVEVVAIVAEYVISKGWQGDPDTFNKGS